MPPYGEKKDKAAVAPRKVHGKRWSMLRVLKKILKLRLVSRVVEHINMKDRENLKPYFAH
jgi:hypothetical protein